jgi:hypothetical protein
MAHIHKSKIFTSFHAKIGTCILKSSVAYVAVSIEGWVCKNFDKVLPELFGKRTS